LKELVFEGDEAVLLCLERLQSAEGDIATKIYTLFGILQKAKEKSNETHMDESTLMEGWITKKHLKGKRKRYFVLREGVLSYFKSRKSSKMRGEFVLNQDCFLRSSSSLPKSLELATTSGLITLIFRTESQKLKWAIALSRSIFTKQAAEGLLLDSPVRRKRRNSIVDSNLDNALNNFNVSKQGTLLSVKNRRKATYTLCRNMLTWGSNSRTHGDLFLDFQTKVILDSKHNILKIVTSKKTMVLKASDIDEANAWQRCLLGAVSQAMLFGNTTSSSLLEENYLLKEKLKTMEERLTQKDKTGHKLLKQLTPLTPETPLNILECTKYLEIESPVQVINNDGENEIKSSTKNGHKKEALNVEPGWANVLTELIGRLERGGSEPKEASLELTNNDNNYCNQAEDPKKRASIVLMNSNDKKLLATLLRRVTSEVA